MSRLYVFRAISLMLCFLCIGLFGSNAFCMEIEWKVVNRFPVFTDSSDFERLESRWPSGASATEFLSVQNASSLSELLPIDRTLWNRSTGRYDKQRLFETSHSIRIRLTGADEKKTCTWIVDSRQFGHGPCSAWSNPVEMEQGRHFSVSIVTEDGQQTDLSDQKIETDLILGLGDSYSSGEGNPDHAASFTGTAGHTSLGGRSWFLDAYHGDHRFATSARWWDEACHRSLLSWQALFAMERAVNNPHRVVQFASFACSGAEIYDGFFRAQLNPPGAGSAIGDANIGITANANRDGGWVDISAKNERQYPPNTSTQHTQPKLLHSQLDSSIDLLCTGSLKDSPVKVTTRAPVRGIGDRIQFGDYTHLSCAGGLRSPDIVLMSFGGNDFAFSSVVKWAIFPDTARQTPDHVFRQGALNLTRRLLRVENPKDARSAMSRDIEYLYKDLNDALVGTVGVQPKSVFAYVYPDPLPVKDTLSCQMRVSAGYEALGQFVRSAGKKIPFFGSKFRGWTFEVNSVQAQQVQTEFIAPLRSAQTAQFTSIGWNIIDAQQGFTTADGDRNICAVASACDEGADATSPSCMADRFAWAPPSGSVGPVPLIAKTTDWEPYDARRMRGLRTANDAVLTQATFDQSNPSSKVSENWMSGMVHPTATVHAAISTYLTGCEKDRALCHTVEQSVAAH